MDYATAQEVFDALSAPFPTDSIEWRVGSTTKDKKKGMALAYINARTVMDRLDSVIGPDGWQCNYTPAANMLICNIGVLMPNNSWVWKSDGAGATDFEADKGMASDAFKRAGVRFGIARYLYDMPSPWVELDEYAHITKEAKGKLDEAHEKAVKSAQWGDRPGIQVYRLLFNVIRNHVTQPSDVIEFEKSNSGLIAGLPVGMRRHLQDELSRIGSTQQDAAE